MRVGKVIAGVAIALAQAGAQQPQSAAATQQVPLYTNLGTHGYAISTRVADAQRYFDQGLRLTWAFNHPEAIRAFDAATRRDSTCAMCYWGIAFAYGPNINAPMDSAAGVAAYRAAQHALRLGPHANPRERALIAALATRYGVDPVANRATHDSAYANAMAAVAAAFPDDAEIRTLYADAIMNLSPWDYWTADYRERPQTRALLDALERTVRQTLDHPGACHLYIHAVEAAYPERAVACAERLAALMPGAGHLVHMPGHIYIRTGRWADAIEANVHAVHADETYITDQRPEGAYPLAYYPHNYHFMSFAATMAGRADRAISSARAVNKTITPDIGRAVPPLEPLVPFTHLTLVTFGRWDDVLAEAEPPPDLRYATAMTAYARGVAFAAKQRWNDASAALDTLRAAMRAVTGEPIKTVIDIANHALVAEIHFRRGQTDGAIEHFRVAAKLEDGLSYMEPPHWYYPIRHSLGAALLKAGKAVEAEKVYREDLRRFPENGWSLLGLAQSLRAQNRMGEAVDAEQRFRKTWGTDGVPISASRF